MSEQPENKSETEMLYELGFHLLPTLNEEEAQKELDGLKETISKNGGEITAESGPAIAKLAYTMVDNVDSKNHKYETAYFGWIKFTAEAEQTTAITGELEGIDALLRHLLIKTVAETDTSAAEVVELLDDSEKEAPVEKEGKREEKKEDKKDEEEAAKESEEKKEVEEKEEKKEKVNEEEVDKAIDELVEDKA